MSGDKSRRRETRFRALVDNEILRISRLHQSEIYKGQFYTCNSSKITNTSSSSSVSSRDSITAVVTRFFPWKHVTKRGKERLTQARRLERNKGKNKVPDLSRTKLAMHLRSRSLIESSLLPHLQLPLYLFTYFRHVRENDDWKQPRKVCGHTQHRACAWPEWAWTEKICWESSLHNITTLLSRLAFVLSFKVRIRVTLHVGLLFVSPWGEEIGRHFDLYCPYFLPEVMMKFTRNARGHFVALIQIPTPLITGISGHNCKRHEFSPHPSLSPSLLARNTEKKGHEAYS